jgi:aconitate hydratase
LVDVQKELDPIVPIAKARVLALLGDSVTTDHISPAGSIAKDSPAGKFLMDHGVAPADFNSYGSRRGNDRVMLRGTFANIRIRNQIIPGVEGGWTRHLPDGEKMTIYDAAMKYKAEGTPLIILAGQEYGTGSSRDWAAKGTYLMGVLPLEFPQGESAASLELTGEETFEFEGLDDTLAPRSTVTVRATAPDGKVTAFPVRVRIDTPVELDYYKNGGILQTVLRKLLSE